MLGTQVRPPVGLTGGSIRTADEELALRPKAFEVLRYPSENAGGSSRDKNCVRGLKIAVTDKSFER
jgi:hypothetical protein